MPGTDFLEHSLARVSRIIQRTGAWRRLAQGGVAFTFAVVSTAALLAFPSVAAAQTAAPGFVYAEAVRGHVVVVNWEPTTTSGTVTYYVYRGEGTSIPSWPTGYTQIASVSGQQSQSYVDQSAKKTSTRYWYVVTAKSSTDTESSPSPIGNGLTGRYQPLANANAYQFYIGPTTGAPIEPTGLALSGADTTITVDWDPVPSTNVAYYRVYRADTSGADGVEIARVPSTQTVYVDRDIEQYHHYYYRVAGEDDQGAIGYQSIEHGFRTDDSYSPPAPHGGGTPDPGSETCRMCHDPHGAAAPKLLKIGDDAETEVKLCLTCHDGTGSMFNVRFEFTEHLASAHEVTITAGDGSVELEGRFSCTDCHTPHGDPKAAGSKKLLYVDGASSGNAVCYGTGCHGPNSPGHWAGDMSGFESSDHNTNIPGPDSGTGVTCSTCHMPHASPNSALWVAASYRACMACHSNENVSLTSPDIYTRMTMNQDHDSHHDVLQRDQDANGTYMACQNCHNTHIVTSDRPLVDPEDPSMAGEWPEGPTAPLAVSGGSATDPKYNGFCLKCHDLSMPTAAMTGGWVLPPDDNGLLTENIADRFQNNNAHGALSAGGTPILNPASGYAYNDTLSCLTCHEPHGTINNFNLRCDVIAKDGSVLTEARLLVPRLDTSGNPTGEYDTRFFCMSCHLRTSANPPNHASTQANQPKTFYYFPTTCSARACHQHGTTSPRRF